MVSTVFQTPGEFRDNELRLVLKEFVTEPRPGRSIEYKFTMTHADTGASMGEIRMRLGDDEFLIMYAGQIGYDVDISFRGHRFASRSVRLLLPFARAHGIDPLWITCNPENVASRRSCELAGGEMIEVVELPVGCEMYLEGERFKCRYRFQS